MPFNPVDHRICFAVPERITPSAWTQHVPMAMLLIDLLRPHTFVELGTFSGTSYCAFCQAVKTLNLDTRCFAVDTWKGDEHGGFYSSYVLDDLKEHHDPRYSSFSQLIQGQFDAALPSFADGSIDLLHIDGYHSYEVVRHDFDAWLPKMSRSGVVVFHDITERSGDFGVWRLWEELKIRYPVNFEFVHGHGLGIVAVGDTVPDAFQQFALMTSDQTLAVRDLFCELGRRIESLQDLRVLEQQLADNQQAHAQQLEALNVEHTRLREEESAAHVKREEALQRTLAAQHAQQRTVLAREYETALAASRARLEQSEANRNAILWQLKWLEASKFVRAVKLARAARAVLARKGPFALTKRVFLWLIGRRGYHLRDIDNQPTPRKRAPRVKAPQPSPSLSPALASTVREQQLPPESSTFTGASIVIPVFNALDDARNCVESIYRVGAQLPLEVIVIDNGSRPDVLEWLRAEHRKRERFWYISLTENLGFSKAINLGIEHARGEYIALQNSDTIVTTGWLNSIIAAFQSDPQLAVVSPLTNYVGNGPQIAEDARQLPVDQAEQYAASIADHDGVQYVADRLVFFCVVIPRRVITMLGGLSGVYGMGNFEDDDYCVRAITAGYKLGIARSSFVYHLGSRTFHVNNIDHDGILDANRVIFVSRASKLSVAPLPALWQTRVKANPLVSVVVRTKDRPVTLQTALMSLANQTLDRFEVVVVNDGGPDVSPLLEPFERRLTIRYVTHESPRGAAAALNTGLNAATGEWMAYLDDDDIVYPYHLNALWSTLIETGARFAYADHTRVLVKTGENGEPIPVMWRPIPTWEFSVRDLYTQDYLPIHTWMHARADAIELGGFRTDLDVHEDWDLLLRLAHTCNFTPTRQVSAEYRFYVDSLSNSIIQRRARSLELLEVMYQRYPVPTPAGTLPETRNAVRQAVQQQITDIDNIQKLLDRGEIDPIDARRRMVAAVTGMMAH